MQRLPDAVIRTDSLVHVYASVAVAFQLLHVATRCRKVK